MAQNSGKFDPKPCEWEILISNDWNEYQVSKLFVVDLDCNCSSALAQLFPARSTEILHSQLYKHRLSADSILLEVSY